MPSTREERTVERMPGRARGRCAKLVLGSHHKEEVAGGWGREGSVSQGSISGELLQDRDEDGGRSFQS